MFFRVRTVGSAERILSSFLLELSLQLVNIILMHFKLSCSGAHHLNKIFIMYILFFLQTHFWSGFIPNLKFRRQGDGKCGQNFKLFPVDIIFTNLWISLFITNKANYVIADPDLSIEPKFTVSENEVAEREILLLNRVTKWRVMTDEVTRNWETGKKFRTAADHRPWEVIIFVRSIIWRSAMVE